MRNYRDTLAFQQDISLGKELEYELKEKLAEDSSEESDRVHDKPRG
ncbi:MAG: hypothetical protein Q8Q31_04270 [Nanoarchaeota archaeon]|nr:hypothetical protein [Nanoarchaeota archaeon]